MQCQRKMIGTCTCLNSEVAIDILELLTVNVRRGEDIETSWRSERNAAS
jgi:hypothetical protein